MQMGKNNTVYWIINMVLEGKEERKHGSMRSISDAADRWGKNFCGSMEEQHDTSALRYFIVHQQKKGSPGENQAVSTASAELGHYPPLRNSRPASPSSSFGYVTVYVHIFSMRTV